MQVVKENQVIIGIGAGASRKRYVVYKVEHTARGYVYHMVDTETKEISQTDILRPLWKSHATLTLLATQDLPTFGYNMIDPLKSWCWGSILFYPFKISRFS